MRPGALRLIDVAQASLCLAQKRFELSRQRWCVRFGKKRVVIPSNRPQL